MTQKNILQGKVTNAIVIASVVEYTTVNQIQNFIDEE